MAVALDALDRKILAQLQKDASVSLGNGRRGGGFVQNARVESD